MTPTRMLSLALPLLLGGCALYSVNAQERDARRLYGTPGIPFYARTSMCVQETVYQEPGIRAEIVLDSIVYDKTNAATGTVPVYATLRAFPATDAVVKALLELKSAPVSSPETFRLKVDAIGVGWVPTGERNVLMLVSNQVKPKEYIDYSRIYYLNVTRPWIGPVSGTVKLNADGTLGEVSATADDQTLKTALDVFPLHDLLLDRLGLTDAEESAEGENSAELPRYRVRIDVNPAAFTHTLSRPVDDARPPCGARPQLTMADGHSGAATYSMTVTTPGAPAETAAPKPENAIGLSGTITLPEPKKP